MRASRILFLGLLSAAIACPAPAPAPGWQHSEQPKPPASTWQLLTWRAAIGPRSFVTEHEGVFNGIRIAYRATVAETTVRDTTGRPAASVFTIAYTATGVADPGSRPVIFIFNGGPGAASGILHFGAFGPKRMAAFTSGARADVKTPLVENAYTVLDVADLVFIDPPETGFSRLLPGIPATTFRSVDGDSSAVAQVVALWLKATGRLASPKYVAGESYGTVRAIALARDLAQSKPKIELDGLILISQAITYNGPRNLGGRNTNPVAAINRLPEMAATAWYHGKIDNKRQTVWEAMDKARIFARTGYAEALLLGNRLDAAGRRCVAEQLASLTGIPATDYLAHKLRVQDFRGQLLRDEGLLLGRYDSRETQEAAAFDGKRDWETAMMGITANMNEYASRVLRVTGVGDYVTLVPDPGFGESWRYIEPPAPTLDVILTEQMRANPNLRLMVPLGIFDMTSSVGSTELIFSQLDISADRVKLRYYPGGHVFYSDLASLKAFTSDVRAFVGNQPMTTGAVNVSPAR
jgi:carboxypeptidase C (cathepsin A)